MDGFEIYNFEGIKQSKKGRASGGFVIGIKQVLSQRVSFLQSKSKYTKWCNSEQ